MIKMRYQSNEQIHACCLWYFFFFMIVSILRFAHRSASCRWHKIKKGIEDYGDWEGERWNMGNVMHLWVFKKYEYRVRLKDVISSFIIAEKTINKPLTHELKEDFTNYYRDFRNCIFGEWIKRKDADCSVWLNWWERSREKLWGQDSTELPVKTGCLATAQTYVKFIKPDSNLAPVFKKKNNPVPAWPGLSRFVFGNIRFVTSIVWKSCSDTTSLDKDEDKRTVWHRTHMNTCVPLGWRVNVSFLK